MSTLPPDKPNRWPTVLLFLAAIGVPSVAGVTFAKTITDHPWDALGIGLLYEIGVLLVGFLAKVVQQLEDTWVQRSANWIDVSLQQLFSGYLRYYFQQMIYQHRDFDVKGLSTQGIYALELEQVFVELSINPKAVHQISADPLKVPEELRTGTHAIWDYLASDLLKSQHLVLIGAPGSGKTTLLKHVALTLVNQQKRRHIRQHQLSYHLPFLLSLREHAQAIKDQNTFSLVDAVQTQLSQWDHSVPTGWVKKYLSKGGCLILLDGLDEVANQQDRQQVVNWVQQQMAIHGKNRFLVTSRPFGYRSNPLSGVTILEVHTFTPDQVAQFVHNWYQANEIMSAQKDDPGVRMKARDGAKDLLQRLNDTPAFFALVVNPLLLTMIATVHRYRSTLPGKRVQLYAEICEVFLGKRQEARGIRTELSSAQSIEVLQSLAYHMMCVEAKDIEATDAQVVIEEPLRLVSQNMQPVAFLKMVENMSGLLLEKEQGVYRFAHLTFQEYLAALYVREHKLEADLALRVEESWWHETIRLYCAQADATPIIAACLAKPSSVPALMLAFACRNEALKVQPMITVQLDSWLQQNIEASDAERRHLVAEVLLAQRLSNMVYCKDNLLRDTTFITGAEYQLFLDEQDKRGHDHRPDHWPVTYFSPGQAHEPVLGVRPSDASAFCAWLTEREGGIWSYRLPRRDDYRQKTLHTPSQEIGYWEDNGETFVWMKTTAPQPAKISRSLSTQPLDLDSVQALATQIVATSRAARTLINDRNRAVLSAFDLCNGLRDAGDLSHAGDLASTLSLARALMPELPSDSIRSRAGDLAQTLIRDNSNALTQASLLARDNSSNNTLTHLLSSALANALASIRGLALESTNALAHDLANTLTSDFAYARNLASIENRAFVTPQRCTSQSTALALLLIQSYIRTFALADAISVLWATSPSLPQRVIFPLARPIVTFSRKQERSRSQKSTNLDRGIEIYRILIQLEQRMQGTLPACEGIMIVKERQPYLSSEHGDMTK